MNIEGRLNMTEVNETDRVKRNTRTVDFNGIEPPYKYASEVRITTVTYPAGTPRITFKYLNGWDKFVTGAGVVPRYYTYGVDMNRSMWARVDTHQLGVCVNGLTLQPKPMQSFKRSRVFKMKGERQECFRLSQKNGSSMADLRNS